VTSNLLGAGAVARRRNVSEKFSKRTSTLSLGISAYDWNEARKLPDMLIAGQGET
jgi:hypothetical protein